LENGGNSEARRFATQDAGAEANGNEPLPPRDTGLLSTETAFRADQDRCVTGGGGREDLGQGAAFLLPQHQAQLFFAGGKSLSQGQGDGKPGQDRSPALAARFPYNPPPALEALLLASLLRHEAGAAGHQRGEGGDSQFRSFLQHKVHFVALGQGLQKVYREGPFHLQPSLKDQRLARPPAVGFDAAFADGPAAIEQENFLSGFEAQNRKVVENLFGEENRALAQIFGGDEKAVHGYCFR
jgi:hypothetical protein